MNLYKDKFDTVRRNPYSIIGKLSTYLECNAEDSPEPPGWYLCKVKEHHTDSSSTVRYNKNTTEIINLVSANWKYAKGNNPHYLPIHQIPTEYYLKDLKEGTTDFSLSHTHKAKAFADDLTLCSESLTEHQGVLTDLDNICKELGLTIRPNKCVSIVIYLSLIHI